MNELTEQPAQALKHLDAIPPRVVNPWTKETLCDEDYQSIKYEYDDSPWTRKEFEDLAWQRVKYEDRDEYDDLPEKP